MPLPTAIVHLIAILSTTVCAAAYDVTLSSKILTGGCTRTHVDMRLSAGMPGYKRQQLKRLVGRVVPTVRPEQSPDGYATMPDESPDARLSPVQMAIDGTSIAAADEKQAVDVALNVEAGKPATAALPSSPSSMPLLSERRVSEPELEAAFFSMDADGNGELDLMELEKALDVMGIALSKDQVATLFAQSDTDGGGTIDYNEFRKLAAQINLRPAPGMAFAMNLFRKYDEDESGMIDKYEFKAIAQEIQADYQRRRLISMAAAGAGAFLVSKYSEEYAFVQKNFRSWYLEKGAEEVQQRLFPTAMLSSDLDEAIFRSLSPRGFTSDNTLLAHSVCSDEVNDRDEELVDLMVSRWGEGFSLGGLAGLPFAGKSGFRAFLHHVPNSGRLLVLFAPHVGIDAAGRVGSLQRDGQADVSKACGAAVGAYKAILSEREAKARTAAARTTATITALEGIDDADPFDPQLEAIIELLEPRLEGLEAAPDPIAFVTYQMYAIVRDKLDSCIANTADVWDYATEVALVMRAKPGTLCQSTHALSFFSLSSHSQDSHLISDRLAV